MKGRWGMFFSAENRPLAAIWGIGRVLYAKLSTRLLRLRGSLPRPTILMLSDPEISLSSPVASVSASWRASSLISSQLCDLAST